MKKLLLLVSGIISCLPGYSGNYPSGNITFLLRTTQVSPNHQLRVYIDWNAITKRTGPLKKDNLVVVDRDNDKTISPEFIDTDNNGIPEGIFFTTPSEPDGIVRTFLIGEQKQKNEQISYSKTLPSYDTNDITFLTGYKDYAAQHGEPELWSELVAKSVLSTYPNPADLEVFSKGKWSYTNGFFLNALFELYKKDRNTEWLTYMKQWADLFVTGSGNLNPEDYSREIFELDNILPGRLLISLYQETGDDKYRKAAHELTDQLDHQPRTSEGGFWHKKIYTQMMWLDGIYMGDVFLAQYAKAFQKPAYTDEAVHQIELIYNHTRDPRTGLLYHGWDESKNKVWADSVTGHSPEFWGRAIGWYAMAVVDVLDYLPAHHPERDKLIKIFRDLSASLANFQDTGTGMWYQVVDKGSNPGNWPESSCTAMFAYAFAKGYKKGYLDSSFLEKAKKANEGLKTHEVFFDDQGRFYLTGTVKVGTLNPKVSRGDYNYYITTGRRTNDFKGVGAFLYLEMELEENPLHP